MMLFFSQDSAIINSYFPFPSLRIQIQIQSSFGWGFRLSYFSISHRPIFHQTLLPSLSHFSFILLIAISHWFFCLSSQCNHLASSWALQSWHSNARKKLLLTSSPFSTPDASRTFRWQKNNGKMTFNLHIINRLCGFRNGIHTNVLCISMWSTLALFISLRLLSRFSLGTVMRSLAFLNATIFFSVYRTANSFEPSQLVYANVFEMKASRRAK